MLNCIPDRSNEIVWIATAYMLSYTALQPLCMYFKYFY